MSKLYRSKGKRQSILNKAIENLENRTLLSTTLVITKGGTYSGSWESDDPHTPAVLVKTTEPVTIQNSTIKSRGDLIASGVDHVDLTVKNVQGYGLNPNEYGRAPGRFVTIENFDNADIEDNYLESTAGIYMLNYAGNHSTDTVKVLHNDAKNIDGRKSNGAGGWLDFNTRTRKSDGYTEDGMELMQFLQFDKVLNVSGIDIGYNEVINEPGNSRVEDNISIYKSSGTSSSPILIHDNYIQGAYTIKPWQGDTSDSTYDYDWSFSGGGIMLGDGVGSSSSSDPAFVKAYDNTVISTTNYGIALSAGHDLEAYNNRVISAGVLPDGRKIQNQNVGIYVWDSYSAGSSHFYNDKAHDNVAGWVQGSGRNDWWSPVSSNMPNNVHYSGTITTATEQAEHDAWSARVATSSGGGGDTVTSGGGGDTVTSGGGGDTTTSGGGGDTVTSGGGGDTTTSGGGGDTVTSGGGGDTVTSGGGGDTTTSGGGGDTVTSGGGGDTTTSGGGGDTVTSGGGGDTTTSGGGGDTVTSGGGGDTTTSGGGGDTTTSGSGGDTTTGSGGGDTTGNGGGSNIDDPIDPIDFSGVVFDDRDGDGFRDKNEVGIAGRTVYVDENDNGKLDAGEPSAVTDASGNYKLSDMPGDYTVRQIVPTGWYQTAGGAGLDMKLAAPATATGSTTFGEAKYATIGGVLFRDKNKNGKRDSGEPGIQGWTVYLDANNNGWWDKGERTVVSDSNGKWTFTNLKPGVYNVRVQQKDKSLKRTTASYKKHFVFSGSSITNDFFGYA